MCSRSLPVFAHRTAAASARSKPGHALPRTTWLAFSCLDVDACRNVCLEPWTAMSAPWIQHAAGREESQTHRSRELSLLFTWSVETNGVWPISPTDTFGCRALCLRGVRTKRALCSLVSTQMLSHALLSDAARSSGRSDTTKHLTKVLNARSVRSGCHVRTYILPRSKGGYEHALPRILDVQAKS